MYFCILALQARNCASAWERSPLLPPPLFRAHVCTQHPQSGSMWLHSVLQGSQAAALLHARWFSQEKANLILGCSLSYRHRLSGTLSYSVCSLKSSLCSGPTATARPYLSFPDHTCLPFLTPGLVESCFLLMPWPTICIPPPVQIGVVAPTPPHPSLSYWRRSVPQTCPSWHSEGCVHRREASGKASFACHLLLLCRELPC